MVAMEPGMETGRIEELLVGTPPAVGQLDEVRPALGTKHCKLNYHPRAAVHITELFWRLLQTAPANPALCSNRSAECIRHG